MLASAVAPLQSYLLDLRTLALVSLALGIAVIYTWFVRPLLHGPLCLVPGPWYCKISNIPLSFYDLSFCRNDQIHKWHQKYGPIVCIAPNQVSIASLQGTKDTYGATQRWAKSNYFDHFKGFNMRSVFATKAYEEHRTKRKYTSTFYQSPAIYKLPEIEQHVKSNSLAVLDQIRLGQEIDVYSLTNWYALDNITFLALGPNHGTQSVGQACVERDILRDLKYQQFFGPFRFRYPNVYLLLSKFLEALSSRFSYLLAHERLEAWCRERFFTALNDPLTFQSHSLIRHILRTEEHHVDKIEIDPQYVAAEILDNINAAEATVAVTATYLIWRLTEAPAWQRKIRTELISIPKQQNGSLAFSDVDSQAPSLEACLREAYRLHPASSGRSERVVPSGGHNFSGVYVHEGTIVANSVTALHHNKDVFPEPECFAPERWLGEDKEAWKLRDAYLIPFGYGGRVCLGKALATLELKMLIASLYLELESFGTLSTNPASMKQCSTHDAVPRALQCMVRFERAQN
ncbi:related to benzoate 4-monooxygenase cytochrome P450 [Ramularia collo-cygni]|uniref:Related to benzoate 4-monooxygenase cytochrome P450 n=1 Tax=Ramularia collo-cygni TaxID=112498 RepID=A0A2D3V7Y8_9PEZI|nr:related to benzoate 4-monooxygenase cytochrome P450 [Ramularia collo-cygni]CZT20877.1 related to benzoate 4-monooxygenase cytochrome P450 [Ramularia collo-cygni]